MLKKIFSFINVLGLSVCLSLPAMAQPAAVYGPGTPPGITPQIAGTITPYLGIVDTGNQIPSALSGSLKFFNAEKIHITRSRVVNPQVIIPNFYITSGSGEIGSGGSCTVAASIFWNGVWNSFTFGGSATGTVANTNYLISDPLPGIDIPAGTAVHRRLWESCPSGIFYQAPQTGADVFQNTASGEAFQYSATTLTNLTTGGTITSSDTVNIAGDLGMIASTTSQSFAIFGDSIVYGLNDTVQDASTNFGTVPRAIGPQYGYIAFGVPSRTQGGFISSHTLEVALGNSYTSGAINQLGVNDVNGGLSVATMEANAATIAGYTPTKQTFHTTITPVTTSSNSYADTVGQTVTANEANRTTWNTQIRTIPTGFSGYMEMAGVIETNTSSLGITVLNGGRWKAPTLTADGLHPNPTGNLQFNGVGFNLGPPILYPSPMASLASLSFNGGAVTITGTGTPTCASTGTGCTNSSGTVTAGSAATSVVVTFNGTFGTGAPSCVVWPATQLVAFQAIVTATAITITQTATSGDNISYICHPH